MSALRHLPVLLLVFAGCSTHEKSPKRPDEHNANEHPVAPKIEADVPITPEQAYAQAMPATVLVTTAWGHGTGVFVDEKGLVLTNYHVVATGKNEDFEISATVTIPERHEDGSVTPGERFKAVVYKVDEKRDLALLKVISTDRKFPVLPISGKDPQPGARVFAVGNAGVGLGWALKRCSINAIGTLDEQVSAIFQMQREEISAEEKARTEEAIKKAAAEAGRQIQTDCNILPGDSGGPLVDETTGRVVGLNVAIRTAFSQFVSLGSLAFHIHVAELRDFLKDHPDDVQRFVPDPWVAAGNLGALSDFDQDGEIDSLTYMGSCGENLTCQVAFADVDENSFRKKKDLPSTADLQTSRAFDAELAVLRQARLPRKPSQFPVPIADTLAYLDLDDDGKFDRLVVVDGETGSTRGYKLGDKPERDTSLDNVAFASIADQFKKASLRPAITRFVGALVTGTVELANLDKMRALSARLEDYTKDGKPDTLHVDTRLDKRVLFELDEQKFGEMLKSATTPRARAKRQPPLPLPVALVQRVRAGRVHGDVLVVLGAPTRVYYDTDENGTFDLVLEGASLDSGVALGAAAIDASGRLTPSPQNLGRRLLRPGLITDKARAAKFAKMIAGAFPSAPRADAKDDASSFPPGLPSAAVSVSPIGDFGNNVVSVFDSDSVVVLVDLDKNSFHGKNAKKDPLDVVKAGKFDAEVSLRFANGIAWAYYDVNDDGRFDHVFITNPMDPKRIALAYKLGKKGAEVDKSREGGAALDPKLVKNAAQQKFLAEVIAKLWP